MKTLADMRPVYVAGIGLHPYQNRSQTSYVTLGLRAVRESLEDAGIEWPDVESAYIGNALVGMAAGAAMLRYLGATAPRPLACDAPVRENPVRTRTPPPANPSSSLPGRIRLFAQPEDRLPFQLYYDYPTGASGQRASWTIFFQLLLPLW